MFAGHMPAPGRVELVDIPEPELPVRDAVGPGQIIFQPTLACLCGSDLPFFRGSDEYPILEGHSLHEMIGRVVATNGERFQVGDEVLAVPLEQRGLYERYVVDETRAIPVDGRVPSEHALLAQPLGTVIYALKAWPRPTQSTTCSLTVGCFSLKVIQDEVIPASLTASRLVTKEKSEPPC